jgi:murein DD-endopeptidase MepM/ murein hydrolase activator NlpD
LKRGLISLILLLLIVSCSNSTQTGEGRPRSTTPSNTALQQNTPTLLPDSPTFLPTPLPSSTPSPQPTVTQTPERPLTPTPLISICSPLEGVALSEIPSIVSNLYLAPRPGEDDGHHGVDLAYYSFGDRKAMLGSQIYAVLGGKVAGVTLDRPPYGNLIIIETPLDQIPGSWVRTLQLPTPAPTIASSPRLSCPVVDRQPTLSRESQSLYLLYAHMNKTPLLKTGDLVKCGQQIGEVGTTGASVNPHLHLETRIGPSGTVFSSMAHYETRATNQEMASYCLWRISGWFQPSNPMQLLNLRP